MVKIKIKALSGRFSGFFIRIVTSNQLSFALLICTLAIIFAYRIQLTTALYTYSIRPFDFSPAFHPVWFILICFPYDLALILLSFLLAWLLSRVQFLIKPSPIQSALQISGVIFSNLFLMALLLIHGAHLRLLFDAQTGISYSIIVELFLNVPFVELAKFIDLREGLFLLLPIVLFWGILASPLPLRIWAVRIAIVFIVLLATFSAFAAGKKSNLLPAEICLNPAIFLLSDMAGHGPFKQILMDRNIRIVRDEGSALQPTGSASHHPVKPIKFLPPKKDQPWNVVIFIMESVGTRYVFDTDYGLPMPMPFLHGLTKESWHLKRHFTTSNISTKAIFSLLSGLYDFFNPETFGIRSDANVPSILNYLGERYDSFLVTPSPIRWYFPTAFVKNSGFKEIHHFQNLNFKMKEELHYFGRYIGRDEIQTADFFIQRINRAKEPFLGIYISFTAHLPYFDYGPDYQVRKEDGRLITRYYNNLNLLDHMAKRIYDHLKKTGLLERTIFIVVGDHGQAFGQHHADNFMHHRYSYNENLETPAIIHQPALFMPRALEFPTSHVDILPTLLDAMRLSYDPVFFDGESLFHNRLRRKYIFFYGHEGSVSSLDNHLIKVQYSLKKNKCWAFDLKIDPYERNPLDCSFYQSRLGDLQNFVIGNDLKLIQYNAQVREKREGTVP